MSGHFFTKLGLIAGGLLLLAAQASYASLITIQNASFENATGYWAESTAPSSWLLRGITGNIAGQSYTTQVSSASVTNKVGNNFLYLSLEAGPSPSTNTVTAWVASGTLGTYQANTVYTLTVAQTASINVTQRKGIIALAANGSIAASTSTAFNLLNTNGLATGEIFQDKQVVLDTSLTPAVVGQAISVRLLQEAAPGSQYGKGAYFDNVRLDAAATIPEPATMGLLAIGALMMLPRR